jgi:hypothetical protein
VNSPDPTTVTASGSSGNASGTLSLVVNTGELSCGAPYDYEAPITTLSTTDFNTGENVTVVDTVGDVPSTTGVKVCYAAGSAPHGTFLVACNASDTNAPCLESLVESDDSVTATFLSPAQDPRFWTGGEPLSVKKFTPAKGLPGAKLTIKGKNLSEVQSVVIGGLQATIKSVTSTKVVVSLSYQVFPQQSLVTVTAASGEAVAKKDFTIT